MCAGFAYYFFPTFSPQSPPPTPGVFSPHSHMCPGFPRIFFWLSCSRCHSHHAYYPYRDIPGMSLFYFPCEIETNLLGNYREDAKQDDGFYPDQAMKFFNTRLIQLTVIRSPPFDQIVKAPVEHRISRPGKHEQKRRKEKPLQPQTATSAPDSAHLPFRCCPPPYG